MVKASLIIAATLCLVGIAPAMAHGHRYRPHHHWGHHRWHHHWRHAGLHHGPYTIGYGDTIISGRTGMHRDLLQMVPDSEGPGPIMTGRRRGSGLGANGLPGVNLDE
jgi:hypothetical protein